MSLTIISKDTALAYFARRLLAGVACVEECERQKPEDVLAIKSDTGEIHYRGVVLARSKGKQDDEEDRVRRFIASDETVDRYGDIIRVSGWRFENFAKNPQALANHDQHSLPIGTVTEWKKGSHQGRKVLKESIDFLGEDLNPTADVMLRMVDAGALRTVSVGFLPIRVNVPKTSDERSSMGLGPFGVEFVEQDQLELSLVTIPANPNAELVKEWEGELREMEAEWSAAADVDCGDSPRLNSILGALVADGTLTAEMALRYRSVASTRSRTLFASVALPEAPAETKATASPAPEQPKEAPAETPKEQAPVARDAESATMQALSERIVALEAATQKLAAALLQSEKEREELAARVSEVEKRGADESTQPKGSSSDPDAGVSRSRDAVRYFAHLLSS